MSAHSPSPEAVEVLKLERARHSESVVDAIAIGACACGWILDLLRFNDHIASAVLVAFMGATVTEPCENDSCVDGVLPEVFDGADVVAMDCPDCPAPRSLAVRECEAAGVLRPVASIELPGVTGMLWRAVPEKRMFREVPPSTGRGPR